MFLGLSTSKGFFPMSNNKDKLYCEKRDQGDYAVRRGGSQRASDVLPTQGKAIERARELNGAMLMLLRLHFPELKNHTVLTASRPGPLGATRP
jgi:hypothetical protein